MDYIDPRLAIPLIIVLWTILIVVTVVGYVKTNRNLNKHFEKPVEQFDPSTLAPKMTLAEYAQMDVDATRRALGIVDRGDETFINYEGAESFTKKAGK